MYRAAAVSITLMAALSNGGDALAGNPLTDILESARTIGKGGGALRRSQQDADDITRRRESPYFFAPWAAALVRANYPEFFFCGAVLIHDYWALSVPYCLTETNPRDVMLRYGADDLRDTLIVNIEKVILHPEYHASDFSNAIALIKLSRAVDNVRVRFATLPPAPNDGSIYGADARVVGWGSITEQPQDVSFRLLQVDTVVVAQDVCNGPDYYAGAVTDNMLCAESKVQGLDACVGFSGSGLIAQARNPAEVIGLVSWGEGCGRPRRPTVYTDVAHFVPWIRDTMEANQ